MFLQGGGYAGLIIPGDTNFKNGTTFLRKSDHIRIFKHTHAMTDPICAEDFDRFYLDEYPRMVALAYALSGNRWAAEEIAQEAFIQAIARGSGSWDTTSPEPGCAG